MKILILGDSYAQPEKFDHFPKEVKAWDQLLSRHHKIVNLAKGASGLNWSVNLLNQLGNKHKQYHKIILFASDPRRSYLNPIFHNSIGYPHFNFLWDENNDHTISKERKKANDILQNYAKYFLIDEHHDYHEYLIYKNLRETFEDKILIVQCFAFSDYNVNTPSYPLTLYRDNEVPLRSFTGAEEKHIPNLPDYFKNNHMITLHHEVLYKKIIQWVDGGKFSLTQDDVIKNFDLDEIEEYKFFQKHLKNN